MLVFFLIRSAVAEIVRRLALFILSWCKSSYIQTVCIVAIVLIITAEKIAEVLFVFEGSIVVYRLFIFSQDDSTLVLAYVALSDIEWSDVLV